jgi:large subunit ribosomal protein L25
MSFAIAGKSRQGNAEALRAEGMVPGVVYGPKSAPVSISVLGVELEKLYRAASESTLIDFTIDGGSSVKVLLQDIQFDPVKRNLTHVDFRQIDMSAPLEVSVEINFVGLAPAVKELGGSLIQQTGSVQVRCLPKDLFSSIELDVSKMNSLDSVICVKDLAFPAGVESLDDADLVVARIDAPMTEEEMKALDAADAVDVSKIEVSEKKGKKEDADAAAVADKK